MTKDSRKMRYSGAYTSRPGTPEYEVKNGGGALPTNASTRRHAALMPLNSGRALPSKWDDAERWITSPVASYGSAKSPIPQPLKSKSGPLSAYSSQRGPNSPLTTGVLLPDGFSIRYDGEILDDHKSLTTSISVPGLGDLLGEASGPASSQVILDDKPDGAKEEAVISHGVDHQDMAIQMSPDGSTRSSSKGRLSLSASPFSGSTSSHQNGNPVAKDEVRDVLVDKGITTPTPSQKRGVRKTKDSTDHIQDRPLPWNASEPSKFQREEAKITAWENMQKAKAEAAILKLEVKLEKKRSASMDRIIKRLRASEMKAQHKRNNLLSENSANRLGKWSSHRGFSVCKFVKVHLPSSCFLCHRN